MPYIPGLLIGSHLLRGEKEVTIYGERFEVEAQGNPQNH
jgi:hypothetical protein